MGCNCITDKIEEEIDDQRIQNLSKYIIIILYI